ncbi:hypothetical protein DC3_54560 [Deinococcus cellulosilyticus NBRC 106333 = KACC 11606]|uniref:Uncharacterized protein n=2 Tax=Deinococcus cellulosilyticus TaxID=401558 RepID=A0A511NBS9_DEIC1|nr:hypothetical protein DC3_54560 [Deinococcus cellulosilyticus NBRC 106333 = KACC 11606]
MQTSQAITGAFFVTVCALLMGGMAGFFLVAGHASLMVQVLISLGFLLTAVLLHQRRDNVDVLYKMNPYCTKEDMQQILYVNRTVFYPLFTVVYLLALNLFPLLF